MLTYFVYVLLNPLKTGAYQYGSLTFLQEPFYVGKGSGLRLRDTVSLKKNGSRFKQSVLKSIRTAGQEPIVQILANFNSEIEAFNFERSAIATMGRRCLEQGPLTNMTEGGEGFLGKRPQSFTQESRQRIRDAVIASNKRRKMTEQHRTALFSAARQRMLSDANPMKNPEIANSKHNGPRVPYIPTLEHRETLRQRMLTDNPMKRKGV